MKILNIQKCDPQLPNFIARLECTVDYNDGHSEIIWIETSGPNAAKVTDNVDPWIVMLLPLAVTLGEDIETTYAIDNTLLSNLRSLQRVWLSWYPNLTPIEIKSNTINRFTSNKNTSSLSASFFSGGVDSLHILSQCTGPNRIADIDGLITVWGFDIPLSKPEEFDQVRQSCVDISDTLDLESNVVATNMRVTRFRDANWGSLSHGCALSSIALLFGQCYDNVLIGSTHRIPDFQPWGSTVITDPLCSSSECKIIHFGANCSRVEKTRALIDFEPAKKHLRVCWKEQSAGNCGKCSKCVRTMSTLHFLGKLKEFDTFPKANFSLDMLAKVEISNANDAAFITEIAEEAAAVQELDTADAANTALKKYTFVRPVKLVLAFLLPRSFIRRLPYFWRFAR